MSSDIVLRIKEIREYKKMKQSEFASVLGVKQANMSHMENHGSKVSIETLRKLISVLNIDVNWLLTGQGEMFRRLDVDLEIDRLRKDNDRLLRIIENLTDKGKKDIPMAVSA